MKTKDLMKKGNKKNKLPDMIYSSKKSTFTIIDKQVATDSNLSMKAKGLLLMLLSNKNGWKTYETSLLKLMKDGTESLRTGLRELEANGYLYRVRYYYEGKRRGVMYVYGDIPTEINLDNAIKLIEAKGYKASVGAYKKANIEKANIGKSNIRKTTTNKNNINNNNKNKNKEDSYESSFVANAPHIATNNNKSKYVTTQLFDEFWLLYPKRKNSSKAKALTEWNKLCNLPLKKGNTLRPKWKVIKRAVKNQKKSERWLQQPDYIPHHSTWLHQKRWLDDADSLGVIEDYDTPKSKVTVGTGFDKGSSFKLSKKSIQM